MKRKKHYSAAARRDLADAKVWSVRVFGKAQTIKYFAELSEALERLRRNPGLARDESRFRPELCSILADSHIVYCRIGVESIDIVRVLLGRMDPERHLN